MKQRRGTRCAMQTKRAGGETMYLTGAISEHDVVLCAYGLPRKSPEGLYTAMSRPEGVMKKPYDHGFASNSRLLNPVLGTNNEAR